MATNLTIGNNTFAFPQEGENPPWGSDVTDWASAVTSVLGTIASSTDILNSSFNLLGNISDFSDSRAIINGLYFDANLVRSATVEYVIRRQSSSETGVLTITNTGSGFEMIRESSNDVGIDFSIDNTGQIKYKSNRGSGASTLTCRAKTFRV